MKNDEIKMLLNQALLLDEVHVNNDNSHYEVIVVSEIFMNMSKINQQKMIYEPLMFYVVNNIIHSISVKTYTPEEWEKCKLSL